MPVCCLHYLVASKLTLLRDKAAFRLNSCALYIISAVLNGRSLKALEIVLANPSLQQMY